MSKLTDKTTTTQTVSPVRRVEALFAAEAELRAAAIHFSEWDKSSPELKINPNRPTALNEARASLRAKARAFAALALALEEPQS